MPTDPRITLHGIPNCDTVKRARAWLAEQGVAYDFHDFKKAGVPAALPHGSPRWAGSGCSTATAPPGASSTRRSARP